MKSSTQRQNIDGQPAETASFLTRFFLQAASQR